MISDKVMVERLSILSAGFVLGCTATYLYMRFHNSKLDRKDETDGTPETRDGKYIWAHVDDKPPTVFDVEPKTEEEDDNPDISDEEEEVDAEEEAEAIDEEDIAAARSAEIDELEGSEIISEDSFLEEFPEYDKVQLTWYEEDEVLADPNYDNHLFPDEEFTLGVSMDKKTWGGRTVLYIRNHDVDTDFEVYREKDSYSRAVLGEEVRNDDETDEV